MENFQVFMYHNASNIEVWAFSTGAACKKF